MAIRVAVDIVLFTIQDGALRVLLIKRGIPPFEGAYALPGGFVLEEESLEQAAVRELREETGVRDVYLEQLYSFGDPNRDPSGRVVTVAYYALAPEGESPIEGASDAVEAKWFAVDAAPRLAFDHKKILATALERLRNKLEYTTVGFELLPPKFTLIELQSVYEAILGKAIDKRNFRRKIALLKIVKPLKEVRYTGRKPAQLYRFATSKS